MLAPALKLSEETLDRKIHCLVSAGVRRADGMGPTIPLGARRGAVAITLSIHHIVQNAKLAVSVWGSSNGEDWDVKPLLSFPPKSYCGIYSASLDAPALADIRYLRASWKIARFASQGPEPFFGFCVSAEESK